MNDLSGSDQQSEAGQPGQESVNTPEPEIYTEERIQEFRSEDALSPVHPGEILQEEFLGPLGFTAAVLAARLHMPAESVESLAGGERPITADDALRLARYFDTTPEFWLHLQAQHDLEVAHERLRHELEAITPRSGSGGS